MSVSMGTGLTMPSLLILAPQSRKKDSVTSARVTLRMLTKENSETRDRTGDLQIFSLMLSQLSHRGFDISESDVCAVGAVLWAG